VSAQAIPPESNDLLAPGQRDRLRARSSLMGAWLVLHAWGVILASAALFVLWPSPWTYALAVVLIGGRQLGLAILMHDAAHRLLFERASTNDRVGAWLCGDPIGASLTAYRPYHLQHHRHTQQAGDPDLALSAPFPITRRSLGRKVMRDLLGVTGYQRRRAQFLAAMGAEGSLPQRMARLWQRERGFFVSNLALLGLATAAGVWWAYFALWLLPMMTWYQLISRIRNIAEHAVVPDDADRLRNTRTTLTNPLMRAVLAPYWVNYHLEHHLFVFTPCWKLPAAHRLLVARGLRDRMEVERGYLRVLRRATSAREDGPRQGRQARAVSHI
jgi:fatty acid desaturase